MFLSENNNTGCLRFQFYVCGFPNDDPQRVKRWAVGRTRFMIMTLTAHFTRIAVGDCRDGILFYSYHEVCSQVWYILFHRLVFFFPFRNINFSAYICFVCEGAHMSISFFFLDDYIL